MSDKPVPYMDREPITWPDGTVETPRQVDARLKRAGVRQSWLNAVQAERRRIQAAGGVWDAQATAYEFMKNYPPDQFPPVQQDIDTSSLLEWEEVKPCDRQFVDYCRVALKWDRPSRSTVIKDLEWIASNLAKDVPNVTTAPSHMALTLAIYYRIDPMARRAFLSTYQSKVMSPGEKKPKKTAFVDEQAEEQAEQVEEDYNATLERLFGEKA